MATRRQRVARGQHIAIVLVLSLGFAGVGLAQRGPGRAGPDGATGMGRGFGGDVPAAGELMPDLPVYDADGNEVRLRDLLRGHYTVLILGCLT